MKSFFIVVIVIPSLLTPRAHATTLSETVTQLQSKNYVPSGTPNEEENRTLFNHYCVGNPNSPDIPQPNYQSDEVKNAAAKISETKNKADNALKKIISGKISQTIASAKNEAEEFVKNLKNEAFKKMAEDLLAEVKKADKNGFTDETSKIIRQFTPTIVSSLQSTLPYLAEQLPKELPPMDYVSLKNTLVELSSTAQKEWPHVDYTKLKTALLALQKDLTGVNYKNIKYDLIQNLLTSISNEAKTSTDKKIKNWQNSIQATLLQYKTLVKTENGKQNINYNLINVIESLPTISKNPNDDQKKFLKKINAFIQKLNPEYIKAQISTNLPEINEVVAAFKVPPSSLAAKKSINGYIINLMYGVDSLKGPLLPATQKIIATFKKESANIQNENIFTQLEDALNTLKSSPTPDTYIVDSVLSSILQKKDISKKITEQITKIKGYLKNSQSAEILTSVAASLEAFKKLTAPYNLQTIQQSVLASNYYLLPDNIKKLNLSVGVQKAAEVFTGLASAAQLAESFENTYLKQDPKNVDSDHYYFYSPVRRIYKLSKNEVPANAPQGTVPEAHMYLTQLCGEFRDRATLIEDKVNWVNNIYILKENKPTFSVDSQKNIWSQIPASAYQPYLVLSAAVWSAKREGQPRYLEIGNYKTVDYPVPGFTVCETKYMFSEYIGKNRAFDKFSSYMAGLEKYKSNCNQDDISDYYDFRGDANFKHYSPESNGMIWYALTMASVCQSPTKARPEAVGYTDEDCVNYFTHPFTSRFNAARAGLAAWLFRSTAYNDQFSKSGSMVAIYPNNAPSLAPFGFSFDQNSNAPELFDYDRNWLNTPGVWQTPDIGFNQLWQIGTSTPNFETAYERIKESVDRHTDWYASGYNDRNGSVKNQAYSPFVASSYMMQASDAFTSCYTVPCPNDGLKRWMFIFRVKAKNWYTPLELSKNEPIDFDHMWFDETSFGDSGLANSERAWDRLGTPIEGEFDSILYLINVKYNGGVDDGD